MGWRGRGGDEKCLFQSRVEHGAIISRGPHILHRALTRYASLLCCAIHIDNNIFAPIFQVAWSSEMLLSRRSSFTSLCQWMVSQ